MSIITLTEEQDLIKMTARDFAAREVRPKAAKNVREGKFPKRLVDKMGELGFKGMMVPEEYGGSGLGCVSYVIALEEICAACASTGIIMSVNNSLVCSPILAFGSEKQKKAYLPDLAGGKKLGCFSLSEPDAGSDPASMRTIALRKNDSYVINGTKAWITNGAEADVMVLIAATDPSKG
ncbi:MAG: acyl-CoA dehydrogenase, partial [Candidatus Dadabacteria bacterium]